MTTPNTPDDQITPPSASPATPPPTRISCVLLTDLEGRWLLVQPVRNGQPWALPSHRARHDESDRAACLRTLRQQLGLVDVRPRDLLNTAWTPPPGPGQPARITHTFDCGVHNAHDLNPLIQVNATEVRRWEWTTQTTAETLIHPLQALRLGAARNNHRYIEHPRTAPYLAP